MNTKRSTAIAALFALSALAVIGLSSTAAEAGPVIPSGHYCLSYDEGGTDCSFTTYQQCEATASGIAGECYGNTARNDAEDAHGFGWSPYRYGHGHY